MNGCTNANLKNSAEPWITIASHADTSHGTSWAQIVVATIHIPYMPEIGWITSVKNGKSTPTLNIERLVYMALSDKQLRQKLEAMKNRESFSWLGFLLPAPCPELCAFRNKHPFKRWHFTCLTCPDRRYHYKGDKSLRRFTKFVLKSESLSGHGVYLPKQYFAYTVIINMTGHFLRVRIALIKVLCTIAERIAEA